MTDYISREWLLAEYDRRHKGTPGGARQLIEEAPAADVRRVIRAGWTDAIITGDDLYDTHGKVYQIRGYVCNCCCQFSLARFNFCQNCGADCRGEK